MKGRDVNASGGGISGFEERTHSQHLQYRAQLPRNDDRTVTVLCQPAPCQDVACSAVAARRHNRNPEACVCPSRGDTGCLDRASRDRRRTEMAWPSRASMDPEPFDPPRPIGRPGWREASGILLATRWFAEAEGPHARMTIPCRNLPISMMWNTGHHLLSRSFLRVERWSIVCSVVGVRTPGHWLRGKREDGAENTPRYCRRPGPVGIDTCVEPGCLRDSRGSDAFCAERRQVSPGQAHSP